MDIANFINVNVNVLVHQDNGTNNPFSGKARVWFSQVVPTTLIPGYKAFSTYDPGFDNNMLESGGTIPTFRAEKGSSFAVVIKEEEKFSIPVFMALKVSFLLRTAMQFQQIQPVLLLLMH